MLSKEKITGVNASSISEITGIPRATVKKITSNCKKRYSPQGSKSTVYLRSTLQKNIKDLEKLLYRSNRSL